MRSKGDFQEDDFRWMRDWGFDFIRLPMCYRLWIKDGDDYKIHEPMLERLDRAVLDFCLRARVGVFKSIAPQPVDLLRELKAALPGCVFIYRWMGGQPLDDPARRAREVYDGIMPHLAEFPYDYAEAYNETGLWDDGPAYNEFTVQLAGLLHQTGQAGLAYSFSVGNPPGYANFPYEEDPASWMQELERYWAVYHEGLRAADGLALHQYKLPPHDDKFTLLRHRLVREVLPADLRTKPIFLTEFGLDDVANPGESGWQGSSWNWTAERYARWIIDTWRQIRNEVVGAAIFGCGMPGWESFEILGQPVIADAIRQANEEGEEMPDWTIDIRDQVAFNTGRTMEAIRGICVHHGIAPLERLLGYLKWTQEVNYHFVIAADGQTFYLNTISDVVWHAKNLIWNTEGIAVCFDGDLRGQGRPTKAQFAAFRRLRAWLVTQGVGEEVVGHKMVRVPAYSTECPGDWWPDGEPAPRELLEDIGVGTLERLRQENAALRLRVDYARNQAVKIVDYLKEKRC